MNQPVRTTIVFALVSGLYMVPIVALQSRYGLWPDAIKLALWADMAVYSILLSRWSGMRLWPLAIPLTFLLGAALWPTVDWGFFILAIGIFSWIRSGICTNCKALRGLLAEGITVTAAVLLLVLLGGNSPLAWGLNVCLFFLVQSLYFFMVPFANKASVQTSAKDPFDQAIDEAQRIIDGIA